MKRGLPAANWLVTVAILGVIGVSACDSPRTSPRPSASLLEVEFTLRPTLTTDASEEPTAEPTFFSLPVGWDDAFCAVFAHAVDAQELVIDVERALTEENLRDARGLARDLRDVAAEATALLPDLPDWEPATQATLAIVTLIDRDGRAAAEYLTFFADDSRPALRRARTLRGQVEDETPAANEALAGLAELGITCEGLPLVLEQP